MLGQKEPENASGAKKFQLFAKWTTLEEYTVNDTKTFTT